ncbi:receptor-type tyrosine-protein phosphatase N2-like isoform X2 [Mya arenaria]|uniref:receptor-type tyrosine-protein phosphatase N2-like isoform X2 n=1 Tax=Mya arenaria TaxID=6604 RepID=UPI0022E6103E|nr:receptor-type tyrosine-protein phosphatase N2-like isoform X2 [Mya arenaria]
MWNNYFAILTGILLSFYCGFRSSSALQIDRQFPLGTIGCLFSNAICETGTPCIDDLLFGTCGGDEVPASFAFTLNTHDLTKLQEEIGKLVAKGLTWRDGYTQCIVQNVIVSLSTLEPFSKKVCYPLIFDITDPTINEITSALDQLYNAQNRLENLEPVYELEQVPLIGNSEKRDEIVKVHKYFDKNEKIHKRFWDENSYNVDPFTSYMNYPPDDTYPDSYTQTAPSLDPGLTYWENTGIPYEDLKLVQQYLETTRQRDPYKSKLSELFNLEYGGFKPVDSYVYAKNYAEPNYEIREPEMMPGYAWTNDDDIHKQKQSEAAYVDNIEALLVDEVENDQEQNRLEDISLPPEMANTLDKLIRGEVNPEDLPDEELNFLTPYVTQMLTRLNSADETDQGLGAPEAVKEKALETDMMLGDEPRPFGVDEEEMNAPPTIYRDDPVTEGGEKLSDEEKAKLNQEALQRQFFQKKSYKGGENGSAQNDDIVDTNFAFIEMDKVLDEKTSEALIRTLTKIVSANPGTLDNNIPIDNKLKINIDPVLAGVNASVVAQLASDHKKELEAATGLKFVKSGIGSQTEVEYKSHDDRYFVLTFVLCGCIAGILLAVVVVYLIRRNSRSKDKLQQITSTQETNDAASKDYQDLCRQRMQSKSSEKPEPLHTAASRVGSVSEAQVRSPSSRSSTSSWSEEPVNSNMDISTGHIVLSYMEDHLKNRDRLDREWEAMCAYEADPCSAAVAMETTNARKNRYADVLPYDHSRVVLTTNTNVSGSDYINASTITDHDPRNPAYIATQGPLPHTVADFWQMVWEQGSVVIVMLTKLTENGEAKCHRYWPEEGSDLYHIYEVHLVSEHIWCEDYLVRSFYLKNLQTGETRTVTQFHFLTWPDLGIPSSIKALLDFRRKVNKSYRGRSCPILVHCSDGCGRTGTYSLVDMVLNRMAKGAKEIDIAATLEHIRDQRCNMVKTKPIRGLLTVM